MVTPGSRNRRLVVLLAVLWPVMGAVFAVSLHHWSGQPWWAVVPSGVVFAVVMAGLQWWQYRR